MTILLSEFGISMHAISNSFKLGETISEMIANSHKRFNTIIYL